jgi:hypothetical protein
MNLPLFSWFKHGRNIISMFIIFFQAIPARARPALLAVNAAKHTLVYSDWRPSDFNPTAVT